jgi:zinc finger protein DZIP1
VDLDTLEKIVSIVAFGDIEAEDTRYLSELNFVKVFRLSQLIIEYLLYVQDCLQSTNSWLQQDRCHGSKAGWVVQASPASTAALQHSGPLRVRRASLEKYIAVARLRLRELDSSYRMSKRELRRARKTVKVGSWWADGVINEV